MLYGLYQRWPVKKCLVLGACAGAACLSDPTCTAGMRPLKETLALADEFPFKPNALCPKIHPCHGTEPMSESQMNRSNK
jgi:hypothetical protein